MTYELTIAGQLWTVNAERNRHWAWRSTRAKQWRTDAFYTARAARIPPMDACTIVVRVEQAKGRLADPEAHSPPFKACLDGIVDAGVLPDDTGEYVREVTFCAPTRSADKIDKLVITITPTP